MCVFLNCNYAIPIVLSLRRIQISRNYNKSVPETTMTQGTAGNGWEMNFVLEVDMNFYETDAFLHIL